MITNQFVLNSSFIGSDHLRLSTGGKYITNGQWACRRLACKKSQLLETVAQLECLFPKAAIELINEQQIEQHHKYAGRALFDYHRTHWVYSNDEGDDAVLFVGGHADTYQLWLARRYVSKFELECVQSEAPSKEGEVSTGPAIVGDPDDWDVIVMPMRMVYQEGLGL